MSLSLALKKHRKLSEPSYCVVESLVSSRFYICVICLHGRGGKHWHLFFDYHTNDSWITQEHMSDHHCYHHGQTSWSSRRKGVGIGTYWLLQLLPLAAASAAKRCMALSNMGLQWASWFSHSSHCSSFVGMRMTHCIFKIYNKVYWRCNINSWVFNKCIF